MAVYFCAQNQVVLKISAIGCTFFLAIWPCPCKYHPRNNNHRTLGSERVKNLSILFFFLFLENYEEEELMANIDRL